MADGWITIGTKLDTDKFDRQVSDLEKKMKKEEDKKLIIETKLSGQEEELDMAIKKTDELADAYQRLKNIQDKVASGKATATDFTSMQDLQNTYGSLEKIDLSFQKAVTKQDLLQQKVAQTKLQYDGISEKVSEYKSKIESIQLKKQQADVQKISDSFKTVGGSLQDAVNRATKLALGIFGVRSAYMALRRASSELATYDKQYASNIEYIRYALTQMIAPVLRYIVSLAGTLLSYINAIAQGWFGVNLFANASAKSFQKMKAGAGGVSKAVKEIKKQLAGFDELNVLSDQTSEGAGGGAGGGLIPDFDLSSLQGDIPKWLQWIVDNKDIVIAGIIGITSALILMKLGLGGIMSLGIGLAIAGVILLIKDIIKFIKDPSWNNFANILRDLSIVLIGVATAMIAVNATNPIGWIVLLIGVIALLTATLIKNWDKVKEIMGKVGSWINEKVIVPIKTFFTNLWDGIVTGVQNTWKWVTNIFGGIANWFGNIINIILSKFKDLGMKAGQVVSSAFKSVVNSILRAIETILNSPIRAINGLISVINAVPRY